MDRDDVAALFPDFTGEVSGNDIFSLKDDNAKARFWANKDRQMVRVIDLYYQVGGYWHRAIFTGEQILFAGPSEYEDDYGISICPILATTFEIDREGNRYGPIRHMVPLQDEVNSRRSRLLHLSNSRQVQQTDMRGNENRAEAIKQAARADGAIPFGWATSPTQDMTQGQMIVYQQSIADLERMAPSPAVLGRSSGANESGRARMIAAQAGMSELARQFGRVEDWELAIYRTLWAAARQFMTEPFWIRITDDPRAVDFLQINEPVKEPMAQLVTGPDGQPVIDPMTGQPMIQMVEQVVERKNEIAKLDMDITLSTVPDPVTLEQEVFAKLLDYAGSYGLSPFSPEFAAMIELSPLPNKTETLERIKAAAAQMQGDGPDPAQEMMQKLAVEKEQAEIESTKADTAKDLADAKETHFDMIRQQFGPQD